MMTHDQGIRFFLMAVCCCFLAGCASTPPPQLSDTDYEFFVADHGGNEYGPFRFLHGENIDLGGREFVVFKPLTQEQAIVEKMKAIVVPEIDFRMTSLHDVVTFLQTAACEYAPKTVDTHAVQFILSDPDGELMHLGPPAPGEKPPKTKADLLQNRKEEWVGRPERQITFAARYLSLHDALRVICTLGKLQWSIQHSIIVVEPDKKKGPSAGGDRRGSRASASALTVGS